MFFLLKSEKHGVFDDANFPSFISYAMVKICEFSSGSDRDGAQNVAMRLTTKVRQSLFFARFSCPRAFPFIGYPSATSLFGCKGTADAACTQVPINLFSKNFFGSLPQSEMTVFHKLFAKFLGFHTFSARLHRTVKRQKRPTDRIKNSQTGRQRRVQIKKLLPPLARIKILSV